jgi:hypothetical protein
MQTVDARDFQTAYSLLGGSLRGQQSYQAYVAGYANTVSATVQILAVSPAAGGTYNIQARVLARNTDGSVQQYAGTYTVGLEGGVLKIVEAHVQLVSQQ